MIVYVVLDDNNGMMFNSRRQSKDGVLRENLITDCMGSKIWMNSYTAAQFEEKYMEYIMVEESFLQCMEKGDCCLVENLPLNQYEDKISRLIIYRWNKKYPADKYLDITLSDGKWELEKTTDFKGSSHENITKEVWKKC